MYRVPQAGPWWPAVGPRLERRVRQHCGGVHSVRVRTDGASSGRLDGARRPPVRPCFARPLCRRRQTFWRSDRQRLPAAVASAGPSPDAMTALAHGARCTAVLPTKFMRSIWRRGASSFVVTDAIAGFWCISRLEEGGVSSLLFHDVAAHAEAEVGWMRAAAMPRRGCLFAAVSAAGSVFLCLPNVRAKRSPTAGRQARAGENVPRTARPGLVACRWRSA